MYDPTVFDNLKVAFENQVYDLDNLDRKITIVNRVDRMDFAVLSRKFSIRFVLRHLLDPSVEIVLEASLKELSTELLETPKGNPGCLLALRFKKPITNIDEQCEEIEKAIYAIWEHEVNVTQTVSFMYRHEQPSYVDTIDVRFSQKINEEHMGEIEEFLDHVLVTLQVLSEI